MPVAVDTDGSAKTAGSPVGQRPVSTPARNFSFWAKRSVIFLLAVLLVAYGTYGVITDTLVLPAKGGGTFGFHGYPGWVCYLGLLLFAGAMLAEAFDKELPAKKGSSRKIHIYLGTSALLLTALAIALEVHRSDKAYVCTDVEYARVRSPEKAVSAVIFTRYCAEYDPMTSKNPIQMIMVAKNSETLPSNLQRTPVIWMNDNDIDGVSWTEGKLFVRYRAREHVKKGIAPQASSDFPVPVALVRR
ncbi:hypothetical protein B0B52_00695 [Polaromonas sp. A23]|nr:hypothetical protein B0B52_00695 [Polaromonas sp. A23]